MLRNAEFKQPETVRARTASIGSALSWVSRPEKLGPQLVEKSPRTAEFKQPDCRLSQEGQGASFPIDHITPIARGNATEPDHHTLACVSLSPAENWVCFACPIPPRFVLNFDLLTTNTRANWLCFGAFLSPLASLFGFTEDSSQSSRLTPRATRPNSGVRSYAAPPPLATACHRPSNCQSPNGARSRRTNPYIHYITEPGDSCGQINLSLPTRRRPTVDHSLVTGGARRPSFSRACRMAICCNAFPILVPLPCPLMNKRLARAEARKDLASSMIGWARWHASSRI